MRRAAPVFFLAGCIASGLQEPPTRGTEHYSGVVTVIDARSGFPLEEVRVEFYDQPGVAFWQGATDRSGRVRFSVSFRPEEDLPEVLTVQLTKRGYARTTVLFDPEDFHMSATSDRERSRKTVEMKSGRGRQTLDLRGRE